jgi:carotenoid cleavage dioxygenase
MAHAYTQGNYRPVSGERVALDPVVEGRLPVGLDGTYVRTGPNPLPAADHGRYHWLNGDGMVHGVRLEQGRCLWYRNRWVRSPEVARALGEPPPQMPPAMVPEGTGNASLVHHAGRLHAFSEMALPYELAPNLETRGFPEFAAALPAGATTHPQRDPRSGALHLLAYHLDPPYLRHHVIDARGQMVSERALPVDRPLMVHDFGLTRTHLVVFDLPVLFSEETMLAGEPLPYRWAAGESARMGLIPLEGANPEAEWFDMPPCWVSHVAAVRERVPGQEIEIDLIRRPSLFEHELRGDDEGEPVFARCRVDRRRGELVMEIDDPRPQEFPTRDPRTPPGSPGPVWTLELAAAEDGHHLPAGTAILVRDAEGEQGRRIPLPPGWQASELSFVPRHPRAASGDGWLLGFLHEAAGDGARFAVFDATDPGRGPEALVELPERVPFGLHGCWIDGAIG